MANTYTLISSNVLSASAASVTFSSIPSTYTDLVLRMSVRTDRASQPTDGLRGTLNNDTTSNYSNTYLEGSGSAASSSATGTFTRLWLGNCNASTSTTSTFSSVEFYLPSYAGSTAKPASTFLAQENNATAATLDVVANLGLSTSAVNRIDISSSTASNFVSGSSFYLYGIKNA